MNGVSRAVLVATVVLIPALSSAQQTSKSGFDYNYAELGYDKHDFDVSRAPDNIDGDGFTLSGSFKVADDWHVYASYGTANLDFGIDVDTWALGLGYNYSLKPNVDLYGRVLYIDQSASAGQFSAHDNGLGLQFRVRGRVNDKVEVEGGIQYLDVASSDTSLQASVRYYFTRAFSAGVGVTFGGDQDGLGINARFSFSRGPRSGSGPRLRGEVAMQQKPSLAAGVAAAIVATLVSARAIAHHSTAEYDSKTIVEARGEIVTLLWANPHVRFTVSTKAIDGNDALWEIESADLTRLDRAGLPHDIVKVGDVVRFAGNPSTRRDRRLYVTNLLVPDGREILLRGNVMPRFASADRVVYTDPTYSKGAGGAAASNRFFDRVLVPMREGKPPAWVSSPPLTAGARKKQAAYDEVVDDPVLGCVSPGMPRVILRSGPYAVRFVERGSDLVMQNEWFEIDRTIHMDGKEPPADQPYTPLGYSAGRWDGDALVITTTHIDWPYFELYGLVGVPQSRAMRIVERFTPRDGGTTVQYDWTATDPSAFTVPVTYENYATFRWQPSIQFLPYNCVETERKARARP